MMNYTAITKRLSLRIITPVIVFMLLAGAGFYIFFNYVASDFIGRIIKDNLEERATDMYSMVDRSLDELLRAGLAADEKSVRIKQVLTLSLVEDDMRQADLNGSIAQNGETRMSVGDLTPRIMEAAGPGLKENVVTSVTYNGKGYFIYSFVFEPWKWRISLIKNKNDYSVLMNRVKIAYAVAGILLLAACVLFIIYLNRTIKSPLNRITERLKQGINPGYKGIYEFEFLSNNIGNIMESLQNETEKLNSVYHIAISKRGKEFFDEVVLAVARMFGLNACISKIDPGGETAQIISMSLNGELRGDIEVPVKGTPCEQVISGKIPVVIEKDVCSQFPSAHLLAQVGAESNTGIPVFDRKGDVIAIVHVFGRQRCMSDVDMKVLRTIGQMVAAEFETLEKTLYLDNILNSSTDTAIVSADLDYRITYYNPAAEKIFGHKSGEVIGRKVTDIHEVEDVGPERFMQGIETVKVKGEYKYSYEREKDGVVRHIDARIYGMLDDKRLAGYVMMARDISDYKHLEEQLLHSQKLEAVGLLAGGVAHEFNNILMAIMGYGSLLKDKMGEGYPYKKYVDNILMSSEKAAHLTQGLLAFSRKQIINPRPININDIVRRVEGLLVRVLGADIELKTVFADADLMAIADSGQVEQVLMNLATNARDAMPDGGILTIETEAAAISGEYTKNHIDSQLGRYALISVSDTGTGMDERTKEHIFEPFFTSKEVGKGTGLGLSIVFGIIKQHNGNILVYSEPGKGTTFKIYLPLSDEIRATEKESATLPPPRGGIETILLAEDNENVRNLVKAVLTDSGYQVIEADSEQASGIFKEKGKEIQLLLLDVVMPKKSGLEVYEEIRQLRPDVKVLFMSGYTAEIMHRSGIIEEGFDFISKPISPAVLLRKVREVLDR